MNDNIESPKQFEDWESEAFTRYLTQVVEKEVDKFLRKKKNMISELIEKYVDKKLQKYKKYGINITGG